ncbi:MAG: hypothetical protein FJ278_10270, partial [Planctomycetes bacterium]|nr:hypothetical protein [Planctomycetota bacterium]
FNFGYGFRHLVKHDVRDDGMFWERSPGYHFYVVNATVRLCEAALRSGVDLWGLSVADDSAENEPSSGNYTLDGDNGPKSFGMMFEGPLYLAAPDFSVDALADSGVVRLESYAGYYELAYTRTRSPLLAWFLNRVYEKRPKLPLGWSTFSPQGALEYELDTVKPHSGKACGRIDAHGDRVRGAWVSEQVRLQSGKKYRLSVAYRTQDAKTDRPARARLEFYPAQGGAMADLETFMPGGEPSAEWSVLTHEFTMPAKAERFGVELFLWADAGTVWFDDLKLVEVGSDKNLFRYGDFEGGLAGRNPQGVLPWNALPALPTGAPPVADGAFARNGAARAGATLFPSTGLAVLRSQGEPNLCARLTFGPYGGGHGHPDKLTVSVFAHGQHIIPDLPTASYESPLHVSWTNQTISHNTVTVDRQTQRPRSRWGHDRAEDPILGRLAGFHADDLCQIVRATCDNAYPGVVLDRTLCLVGDALLDVFTVKSSAEHTYDWALRCAGRIEPVAAKVSSAEPLGKGDGYELLRNVQAVTPEGKVTTFLFKAEKQGAVRVSVFGGTETQFFLADAPRTTTTDNAPMLVARRSGKAASFVAVYSANPTAAVELSEVHAMNENIVVSTTRGSAQLILHLRHGDSPLAGRDWQASAVAAFSLTNSRGERLSLVGVSHLTLNGQTEKLSGPSDLLLERDGRGAWTIKQRWPVASTGGVFVPGR